MKTAIEFIKKYGIENNVLNREDLPEYWKRPSDLMEEYASQFTPKKESKTIEERKTEFKDEVLNRSTDRVGLIYDWKMVNEFTDYWTEISPNAKKMRFEKEKVFDIKKRLERWNKNQKTFNNGKPTTTTDDAIRSFITE